MSILVPNFSELRILWQITTLTKEHPETDNYLILLSISEEKAFGSIRTWTYPNFNSIKLWTPSSSHYQKMLWLGVC